MNIAVSVVFLGCLSLSAVTGRAADLSRGMNDRFVSGADLLIGRDLLAGCHPDMTSNAAVGDFELRIYDLSKSQVDRAFGGLGTVSECRASLS